MSEKGIGNDEESLRLTRSSTVFHALVRLFGGSEKLPSHLVLHVVGADHREGTTPEETRLVFADLFQRIGQGSSKQVRELDLLFCGPNIAPRLHDTRHSFSHHRHASTENERSTTSTISTTNKTTPPPPPPPITTEGVVGSEGEQQERPAITPGVGVGTVHCCGTSTPSPSAAATASAVAAGGGGGGAAAAGGILAVTLRYNSGLYHDVSGLFPIPHVLFLFNAGLWGYDDWEPTLEHVLGCGSCTTTRSCENDDAGHNGSGDDGDKGSPSPPPPPPAVVVTSYCSEEASDDMETIERVLLGHEDGDDRRREHWLPGQHLSADDASSIMPDKNVGFGGLVEWLWKPEVNPHRSLVPRRTECGVEGRVLFENQSWQALRRSSGRGASPLRNV